MSHRILILQTLRRPQVHSPHNALITLAREVDRGRVRLAVAVPREGRLTEELARLDVRIVRIPGLRTYRRHDALWRFPAVALQTARAARSLRADLIVANHAELGPFAGAAARLSGIPWICVLRQADRPGRYFEKYRVHRADGVAAVSQAALDGFRRYRESRGIPASRESVIPTGIPLPAESPAPDRSPVRVEFGWNDSMRVAGVVGLRGVKRPEVLIESLVRIAARVPDCRALLAGSLEPGEQARLESLASSWGVADRLGWAGHRAEMGPVYAAIDVLAHPSQSEALPKAVLEAMAHSRPVVAFSVGGIAEAVQDDVTGFLCPPGDVECFADRLAMLLTDPGRARKMGAAGRSRVADRFSPNRMARWTAEFFEMVIAAHAGRSQDPDGAAVAGPAADP